MSNAATQYTQPTPASFNNKYYGPMLTAYFHFNDYKALQYVGGTSLTEPWSLTVSGWTPSWQPYFYNALESFKTLPGNQLEILLNVAYNAGYYAQLFGTDVQASASSTETTVHSFNSYTNAWGGDSYHQYPYQVRSYLDQLYGNSSMSTTNQAVMMTSTNHVAFQLGTLQGVFSNVFHTLAYVDASGNYNFITQAQANTAFQSAMNSLDLLPSETLDLSNASERAQIFSLIENAIANLESTLDVSFSATTTKQL